MPPDGDADQVADPPTRIVVGETEHDAVSGGIVDMFTARITSGESALIFPAAS